MGADPISLGIMALSAGAGLMKAGSQAAAGEAAGNAAAYRAQVARNNVIIAEQQAQWAEGAGAAREAAQGMKNRQVVGQIRATQGASGVDIDSGSSAAVRDAAAALGELDALTIRSNTAREAYGYRVQAQSEKAQADLYTMQGEEARRAGKVAAFASLLETASSVGGKYQRWQLGAGSSAAGPSGPDLQGGIWPA